MFFKNTWPALLWAILILALTLSPAPALPSVKWIYIPHADKMVHFVLFGVMYILLMRGLMKQHSPAFYNRDVLWAIVIVILYGAATEILQAVLPTGRDADVMDWLADCAGTLAALMVYGFWWKRKKISA
jgi:VanZ family protein